MRAQPMRSRGDSIEEGRDPGGGLRGRRRRRRRPASRGDGRLTARKHGMMVGPTVGVVVVVVC